ncbi:MAG: tRNA 4-thiouridine(8) synthase ThiI [Pseudomonadales bacterium]|nr:tRNA 4-thiouridine(8) synthase ThiI [Pseudomonadales bacterium]MCP5357076.1 tRNA 4-thiouridine(8) synthase ThiI [Pseudomonadales bacterium]
MKYLLRFFPEIIIKSREVRQRYISVLRRNLRTQLDAVGPGISVTGGWDSLSVDAPLDESSAQERVLQILTHTPGIDTVMQVQTSELVDLDDVARRACELYAPLISGRSFAVRCKRVGKHSFNSIEVERVVGAALMRAAEGARVDLSNPDVSVRVGIQRSELMLVENTYKGLGGYPLGTQDGVLSLISGGFDSTVSSYQCIKRGLLTHYCFFRLGGAEHEIAVKEVALYLWMKYGASHRVKFVTVPFEEVIEEIVSKVDNSQMGVIFKRVMMRAAGRIADRLKVEALITGESVAQVASQTLANLAIIDGATDKLILRPLITVDKREIIDIARAIGTEEFVKNVPEYCSVVSVRPTTRARMHRIEREEANFDEAVLQAAIERAEYQMIDRVMEGLGRPQNALQELQEPGADTVVIDIRHPDEEERNELVLGNLQTPVLKIPFYQLRSRFAELPNDKSYALYCEKGMMSRLHASHLREAGHANVAVYRPVRSD